MSCRGRLTGWTTAAGLIFGIVADMDEIPDDPQMLASEALVPFVDGDSLTVNSPIWIRGQEKVRPRPASSVGEQSEAVLREVGYIEAEIGVLPAERVIARGCVETKKHRFRFETGAQSLSSDQGNLNRSIRSPIAGPLVGL